mmetsp:Transcript_125854/g.355882  ORF Transcript_125854/g.355882 Transcript_125854/m.355882 type:complete len:210 (-) Transcript_125854:157-786(-)
MNSETRETVTTWPLEATCSTIARMSAAATLPPCSVVGLTASALMPTALMSWPGRILPVPMATMSSGPPPPVSANTYGTPALMSPIIDRRTFSQPQRTFCAAASRSRRASALAVVACLDHWSTVLNALERWGPMGTSEGGASSPCLPLAVAARSAHCSTVLLERSRPGRTSEDASSTCPRFRHGILARTQLAIARRLPIRRLEIPGRVRT